MSRQLRIELAGGVYHVTSRGDRSEPIYLDDVDRRLWLTLFAEVCERFNWRCHGWCQMTNHYHIVLETAEGNLSLGMRHLNGVYTQRHNRRHGRVGHVFQGRYKSILVERDAYLLELSRYVILNPVRAGIVSDVGDWAWSSYRDFTGQRDENCEWLEIDWILGQFDTERQVAIQRYVDFVREGERLPPIWAQLKGQLYLGSDRFATKMARSGQSEITLDEVPKAQQRPVAKSLTWYADSSGDAAEAMVRAYSTGDYSMRAIAQHFGVHYSTVSRAIRRRRGVLACKT